MSDDKKDLPSASEIVIDGKTLGEMDIEDLNDAIKRGEIEIERNPQPEAEELYTKDRIDKFIMGEITWAELQGITMEEAYGIAEYGYGLFQEGRYHDARTVFEALVLSNPYDAYFHNMLGAIYQQLDMRDEAMEEYTLATELDEEHLHAWVNRAEMRLQNGDFEGAREDLKVAVELDPDGKDPSGLRARALMAATSQVLDEIQRFLSGKKATLDIPGAEED